jgi:hypothetical protein
MLMGTFLRKHGNGNNIRQTTGDSLEYGSRISSPSLPWFLSVVKLVRRIIMESMIFRHTNSNEIKPSSRFFVIEESNTAKT